MAGEVNPRSSRRTDYRRLVRLPYPFNSPWVHHAMDRILPAWFAVLGVPHLIALVTSGSFGIDARIYVGAARAWLQGDDPWSTSVMSATGPLHFAAPPPNLVPIVPLAMLPDPFGEAVLVAGSVLAGVYLIRRLKLPWWWILFPPLLEGMQSGNPQVILTALLLAGGRFAMLAPTLKVYAAVPLILLGRWREAAGAIVVLDVAAVLSISLWPGYIAEFGTIAARLELESAGGLSAWAWLPLVPFTAAALVILFLLDREKAAWLAVPGLWPSSELHYSTFAMPVVRGGAAAWVFAIPVVPYPALGVILVAVLAVTRPPTKVLRNDPRESAGAKSR